MKQMLKLTLTLLLTAAGSIHMTAAAEEAAAAAPKIMFVMHGGAGAIARSEMPPELEQEYRAKMTEALEAGYGILKAGRPGLDAIEAAIRILEDSPLFNAGKGAVFTNEGTNELDASVMDGHTLAAGAVAGVKTVKNPISLARLVMEKSPHVMMTGQGAETFAKTQGVELVPESYFRTERRWKELEWKKQEEQGKATPSPSAERPLLGDEGKRGTVGAVALDAAGHLSAGTSTGGTVNKRYGRVGDTPIIGAGTYANDRVAVSATGDGEYFIRVSVAHDIAALVEYKSMAVQAAADEVLAKVQKLGGTGGVIVLGRAGNFAMPFNTSGMYRGHIGPDGKAVVEIYRD